MPLGICVNDRKHLYINLATYQDSDRKLQPGHNSPPPNSPPIYSHDNSKLPFADDENKEKTTDANTRVAMGKSVISGQIRTGWL